MHLRWKWSIRTWLFVLPLLSALPLLLFASIAVRDQSEFRQNAVRRALVAETKAGADVVDNHLNVILAGLYTLSNSSAAREGNLSELYAYAVRILPKFPDVLAIALVDADGRITFSTLRPFGEPLPMAPDLETPQAVCEAEQPTISGPARGSISGEMIMSVNLPATIGKTARYCLRMTMKASRFHTILQTLHLPPYWRAVLFTRTGITVTRTMAPDSSAGTDVSAGLLAAIRQGRTGEAIDLVTRDGVLAKVAVVALPPWGLSIAIGVPVQTLEAPARQAVFRLVFGGVASLAVSLVAAGWLSRRLAKDVMRAAAASAAIEKGQSAEMPPTIVKELQIMGSALSQTKEREIQIAGALEEVADERRKISDALILAKHDDVTGLANRSLFFEKIDGIARDLDRDTEGLALLFLDLDDFKNVNDTHGHEKGDEILRRVGQILHATLREQDVAGRIGGDEFVICIRTNHEALGDRAIAIARRIIAGIRSIGYGIGASVGICLQTSRQESAAEMIKLADAAMYAAKKNGKNRFALADRAGPESGPSPQP